MVRWSDSPVDRSQAFTIVAYLDELARELPHPERQWRWGDVDLSHECLYNLKSEGLIQVAEDGRRTKWRTTLEAWQDVRARSESDSESDPDVARVM